MDIREEYLKKIEAIPTVSFNREQKEIAKRIMEQTAEADLGAVYGLITRRVKTGFVFDEAPEVNHSAVALVVEAPELNINVTDLEELGGCVEHKLIIGENYDALKNLCATYIDKHGRGLIDVIYIDPPYNTEASKKDGNDHKDEIEASKFIYRDKFTRDGWLNLMNERLKLARRLLSERGVIFISIDDSEQAYLKVLCDEIFGEQNFVACLHWKKKKQPSFLHGQVASVMEYVLVYAKQRGIMEALSLESPSDNNTRIDNAANLLSVRTFPAGIRVKLNDDIAIIKGGVYQNKTMTTEYLEDVKIENGRTKQSFSARAQFRDSQERIDMFCKHDKLYITRNYGFRRDKLDEELAKRKPITDLLLDWGDNQDSDLEIREIFGTKEFAYPKPTLLIKRLIQSYGNNEPIIILDFFAGSGTTGQAVMELNEEDGGNRRFILVTNNENSIGEMITRERLYRVINGHGSNGEEIVWRYSKEKPSLKSNAVRVFRIENHELTLQDLDKAEVLKNRAEVEFTKLNPKYESQGEFDLYTELAALNPTKSS